MVRFIFILVFTFLTTSIVLHAQPWKKQRWELTGVVGGSNFLGDLGGANRDGSAGFRDLEFAATRHAVGLGIQYRVANKFFARTMLYHAMLSGADSLTQSPWRRYRNLSFRSAVVEFSTFLIYAINKEQTGSRYKLKGVRGRRSLNINSYFFAGIGVFYFNPKAYFNGRWVALQPLGTEGQGRPGGPNKKYSRVSVCLPVGIGFKRSINRRIKVGMEYGLRKTFTDYIDDASGLYYLDFQEGDPAWEVVSSYGGHIADPHLPADQDPNYPTHPYYTTTTAPGEAFRGDKNDKDPYMFITVTVSYSMNQSRNNWPKF